MSAEKSNDNDKRTKTKVLMSLLFFGVIVFAVSSFLAFILIRVHKIRGRRANARQFTYKG